MFQWLEIEGVRYEWDGQQLHCQGPEGRLSLALPMLSNLELEDEDGSLLGYLSVEPAQDRIVFESLVSPDALRGQQILVGRADGTQCCSLAALASEALGHPDGTHADMLVSQALSLTTMLDDVETLDVFFGAQNPLPLSHLSHAVTLTAWSPEPDSLPLFGDELLYL
ncbi:hypothetical protein ABHF91_05195 [Pseudaeromonas sp. ZJS20]|uniref:hypothetical protein n=1 Tax=Pseudaeromonas aegiceratis TaxID=3153928 RepID=UPI00390C5F75